jgi:hypothetical protein
VRRRGRQIKSCFRLSPFLRPIDRLAAGQLT